MSASRHDWKTTPLPERREVLILDRTYSAFEFERIREGSVPKEMEDKWFSFFEEPWLYLHRSWTGFCVYQVRFEAIANGARVTEALASRDPDEHLTTDGTRDALLLAILLDDYAGRSTDGAWRLYLDSLSSQR